MKEKFYTHSSFFNFFFLSVFLLCSAWQPLSAQNKNTTSGETSLTLGVNFATTDLRRGDDRNAAMSSPKTVVNFAPVIQPEITFFTPLRGLYFDLFASVPLRGRKSKDLQKNDQIDFAVVYDFYNRVGFWSVSYSLYAKIHSGENFGELAFSYAFPFTGVHLSLSQYAAHSFKGSLGFLYSEISLGKTFASVFTPTLLLGYKIHPLSKESRGHLDLILPLEFAFKKLPGIRLKLSATVSYVFPDLKDGASLWKVAFQTAVFYTI